MRERGLSRRVSAAWVAAALAFGAGLPAGCAPARHRLAGEEAKGAREFFATAAALAFPVKASFSGIAETGGGAGPSAGTALPFVAGVNARTSRDETVGFYDALGRAVLFVENDGARLTISRGPAAGELPREILPAGEAVVAAGPVSFARILSGAPGYPVAGGTAAKAADGAWVLEDGPQTLFSDPHRRHLARAEYEISGKRFAVSYPDRGTPGPPPLVKVEMRGAKILMRRDAE